MGTNTEQGKPVGVRAARPGTDPAEDTDPLAPERVAEIRRRIAEGAYDSPAMAIRLARRLLDSDDIRPRGGWLAAHPRS